MQTNRTYGMIVVCAVAGIVALYLLLVNGRWTKTSAGFSRKEFETLALGASVDQALGAVGLPYYGWVSRLQGSNWVSSGPLLPTDGMTLTRWEIQTNQQAGTRLSLFYSKAQLEGLLFTKYVLHFQNGKLVDKTLAAED